MIRRTFPILLMLGCLTVAFHANAAIRNAAPENGCDLYYQALKNTLTVKQYAKTGVFSGKQRPTHSRAWYMAALGMNGILKSYLQVHTQEKHNPDLLLVAIYTGRKNTVAMLLGMGFNPNKPGREKNVLPLEYAAQCARPTILVYLLNAGANIYGTTSGGVGYLPIVGAIIGPWLNRPFVEGVKLFLAAGFDPRCPIAKTGVTALEAAERGIQHNPDNKEDKILAGILKNAVKIANTRNPQRPKCGGLNWWSESGTNRTADLGSE